MTNDFLPEGYTIPVKTSNSQRYLNKFEEGETKIRILTSPVIGYEYWESEDGHIRSKSEKKQKGDKPVRFKKGADVTPDGFEASKHFWAMPIWNYQAEMVQILKLSQATIQEAILNLVNDEDWGSPVNYDISIKRTGKGFNDTEYAVIPKAPKAVAPEILKELKELNIDMDKWMNSEDPFTPKGEEEVTINPEDIPF